MTTTKTSRTRQNDPKSEYTFDSERESNQSEICRSGNPNSRECITVSIQSSPFAICATQVFKISTASNECQGSLQSHAGKLVFSFKYSNLKLWPGPRILLRITHGSITDIHGLQTYTRIVVHLLSLFPSFSLPPLSYNFMDYFFSYPDE